MAFDEGDSVVLRDKHSEYDGEVGEITQVSETMFGDETFTVSFEEGQEAGLSADSLEPAPENDDGEEAPGEDGDASENDDGTTGEDGDETADG